MYAMISWQHMKCTSSWCRRMDKICLFTVGGFTKCSTSKEKRRAKPTRCSMWNIKRIFLFFLINEGKKVKVLTWKPQQKQWSLTQHNILRHRQKQSVTVYFFHYMPWECSDRFSICSECKHGKHIRIQCYVVRGRTVGHSVCHCFRRGTDFTFVRSLLS